MRGKAGVVIGLAIGYVLGTRAGRERYEQMKDQAVKVWNLDPVQEQVDKVKDFGKTAVMALPNAVWDGAVKVTKSVQHRGTPGKKLDSAIKTGKDAADEIARAADKSAHKVKRSASETAGDLASAADDVAAATEPNGS